MQAFQLEHKIDLKFCINFIFATFSVIATHVLPVQCERKKSHSVWNFIKMLKQNSNICWTWYFSPPVVGPVSSLTRDYFQWNTCWSSQINANSSDYIFTNWCKFVALDLAPRLHIAALSKVTIGGRDGFVVWKKTTHLHFILESIVWTSYTHSHHLRGFLNPKVQLTRLNTDSKNWLCRSLDSGLSARVQSVIMTLHLWRKQSRAFGISPMWCCWLLSYDAYVSDFSKLNDITMKCTALSCRDFFGS